MSRVVEYRYFDELYNHLLLSLHVSETHLALALQLTFRFRIKSRFFKWYMFIDYIHLSITETVKLEPLSNHIMHSYRIDN